mgnify:CR=1 FL=1
MDKEQLTLLREIRGLLWVIAITVAIGVCVLLANTLHASL